MVSPTQWTWVWANSRRQWKTGTPGMLQSMGSQSQTRLSDWTTTTIIWVSLVASSQLSKAQAPHQEYLAPPHASILLYFFLLFCTHQILYVLLFIPQIHASFSFQVTCTSCSLSLEGETYLCRAISFPLKFHLKLPPLHRIFSCDSTALFYGTDICDIIFLFAYWLWISAPPCQWLAVFTILYSQGFKQWLPPGRQSTDSCWLSEWMTSRILHSF